MTRYKIVMAFEVEDKDDEIKQQGLDVMAEQFTKDLADDKMENLKITIDEIKEKA